MADYIDRQIVIDAVGLNTWAGARISRLPSADVQPVRRGHWIPKFNGEFKGGAYWYDCSECGHTVAGGILSGNNFCENCGARMDGEHND